jgi:DNA-binding MarR family transcriptional regulator
MKRFVSERMWNELSIREYDVLYTLSKCAEPIRLGDLQQQVLLSQPALSRMVDRMVSRGLVRRETDPADARSILLSLTDDGLAAQRRVGRHHARSVANVMTTALTQAQLLELREICRALATRNETVERS